MNVTDIECHMTLMSLTLNVIITQCLVLNYCDVYTTHLNEPSNDLLLVMFLYSVCLSVCLCVCLFLVIITSCGLYRCICYFVRIWTTSLEQRLRVTVLHIVLLFVNYCILYFAQFCDKLS